MMKGEHDRVSQQWIEVAIPRCPVDDETMNVDGMKGKLREAA
jgi:hypothetical protein